MKRLVDLLILWLNDEMQVPCGAIPLPPVRSRAVPSEQRSDRTPCLCFFVSETLGSGCRLSPIPPPHSRFLPRAERAVTHARASTGYSAMQASDLGTDRFLSSNSGNQAPRRRKDSKQQGPWRCENCPREFAQSKFAPPLLLVAVPSAAPEPTHQGASYRPGRPSHGPVSWS